MLSTVDNEKLTRVGPGALMSTLMRRYSIPVAFSKQLAKPDGPSMRAKLLCEDLITSSLHERGHCMRNVDGVYAQGKLLLTSGTQHGSDS